MEERRHFGTSYAISTAWWLPSGPTWICISEASDFVTSYIFKLLSYGLTCIEVCVHNGIDIDGTTFVRVT